MAMKFTFLFLNLAKVHTFIPKCTKVRGAGLPLPSVHLGMNVTFGQKTSVFKAKNDGHRNFTLSLGKGDATKSN